MVQPDESTPGWGDWKGRPEYWPKEDPMTATTDLLDAARKRWTQVQDTLRLATHDVERAKEELQQVATQLRELGFDPDGDLDEQLRVKGEVLDAAIADVEKILANGESAIPPGETRRSEPISSES